MTGHWTGADLSETQVEMLLNDFFFFLKNMFVFFKIVYINNTKHNTYSSDMTWHLKGRKKESK